MNNRRNTVLKLFDENSEYYKERVNYGIELYRKGYNTIMFVDREGKPVNDVKFTIKQKSHDYKFGCNIFMLDEFELEEKNAQYRKVFGETFNYAIAPFYWKDLEPEKGKPRYDKNSPKIYRRPAPDLVVEYCKEKNIDIKAHCIVYDAFAPSWLPREVPLIKKEYEKHMAELSARYSDHIDDWEIINETMNWETYGYSRLGTTTFFSEPDYETWSYFCARRNFPKNNLLINAGPCEAWSDRRTRSHYYYQLEALASKGVKYDGIGMQSHIFVDRQNEAAFFAKYFNPVKMYDVLDTYEHFGVPINISELTIPSYNGGAEDEEVQAEELRLLYSLWFSHKATDQIDYWNFVDGYSYVPGGGKSTLGDPNAGENIYGGGLLRFDMTLKPALKELQRLINKEWHTELSSETGSSNRAKFKGFYGKYDMTFVYNGKEKHTEFHLDKRADMEHIIVCD
ncbi:MAG: endo-1,4-beta-xylanase [Eubacteriales bacterium]|nr:endo-1,4-beta-xylanase [Eubacteriales bacterium]